MSVKLKVTYRDENGQHGYNVIVDKIPNECPLCHTKINAVPFDGWMYDEGIKLQGIFCCPNSECEQLFIGYYKKHRDSSRGWSSQFFYERVAPVLSPQIDFSEIISDISKDFCEIFNEASQAEDYGLLNICGAGYRKALEFLIKDYLIDKGDIDEDIIKNKFLGQCISEDIDNSRIKACAKRAVWIGNDETHYIRKWEEKDLGDLKNLIKLTVRWLEIEKLSEQYQENMPD